MSLSVVGVWQVGAWDQTVWAEGVWREGEYTPAVVASQAAGGYGPPIRVKPTKRHPKLDTFREELNRLILRTEKAIETVQEPEIQAKTAERTEALVERFNIVQTFDDSGIITEQMAIIRQDMQTLIGLISGLERASAEARFRAEQEAKLNSEQELVILLLASEM